MALSGIDVNFENKAILVAIDKDLYDFLEVAAFLTFLPQCLSRSAVICSIAGFNRQIERLTVHIRYHQDIACLNVLCYSRDKSVFIKFRIKIRAIFYIILFSQLFGLLLSRFLINCHPALVFYFSIKAKEGNFLYIIHLVNSIYHGK
jgi:hypothetical protein